MVKLEKVAPIFVVGTGRCGSSFIHELICRHKNVAFISNMDDRLSYLDLRGRWNNSIFDKIPQGITQKGRLRFAPSEAYNLISRKVSPIYADSCRDLVANDVTPWLDARFKAFFKDRCAVQNKQYFVHKYTGWPRIRFFNEIFPESKFINVIRDGRAVANSWLQMPWWAGYLGPEQWHWGNLPDRYKMEWEQSEKSFVLLAGLLWKYLMDEFDDSRKVLENSQYLEVRYEDFLKHPEETIKKIVEFIGLEWNTSFNGMVRASKIITSRGDAFRRDLSTGQVDTLNKHLSDHLEKYGYE